MAGDFSFGKYVKKQSEHVYGGESDARYAYAADITMLRSFRRIKPVELAAASVVRSYKTVLKNKYLGTTVRVGPKQIPRLHQLAERCAAALGVPLPTMYIVNSPFFNAYTFGTDEDAFIVLHSALVEHFDDDELMFVIGHEMGHIQNKHVVYNTALKVLKTNAAFFLRWIVPPLEVALSAWSRRAEITCDRAGLLCAQSLEAACSSFLKMASGSKTLADQVDLDAYLEQFEEGRHGVGRFSEALSSHPYLPKRIAALRVFAQSALYQASSGQRHSHKDHSHKKSLTMEEVDAQTSQIIQILRDGPSSQKNRT